MDAEQLQERGRELLAMDLDAPGKNCEDVAALAGVVDGSVSTSLLLSTPREALINVYKRCLSTAYSLGYAAGMESTAINVGEVDAIFGECFDDA